ncbi:MAG: GAF domain-containing sensor histidine kinase, partial [Actinomycetota bacterium]
MPLPRGRSEAELERLFPGDSEMAGRMRGFDWAATPVGPEKSWPQSLRIAVGIMLNSRYPMFIWWGRELVNLYNDAYMPMLGNRHPGALGKPARLIWSEIWDTIGPQTEAVLSEGRATWSEELLLVMERNQFLEETYFTYSYSPIPDDEGGVGSVFCACTEDTHRVLSQRRLRTMRDLSARSLSAAKSAGEACEIAAATLAENDKDVPFALIYLVDADRKTARLAAAAGIEQGTVNSPLDVPLAQESGGGVWPLHKVARLDQTELVDTTHFPNLPAGGWDEPPRSALVLPIIAPGQRRRAALLIAAVSPRGLLDEAYQNFYHTIAGHIATAIANARAYEEERRRAELLAEIDRAKTLFFTNISHEFRTPLTLMLGPLEDILAKPEDGVQPDNRELLTVVHRHGLRLLKLVNTLLDFSRIEAGRMQATYELTDIAALTSELASMFRSAVEKAGLSLIVDCPAVDAPVFLDRDMWEKIVLNLLSNAFKFTFEGEIEVRLRRVGEAALLTVRDTGVGIGAKDVPHVFER